MVCGNVVTHTSDSAKTEIQVNPFSYFNDAGVDDDTLYRIFSFKFLFSIWYWQILWTAPEQGSGCVTFRATIIEHRDVWYMDDGPLSKDFCEDQEAQEDYISTVLEQCCACYEAKYEVNLFHFYKHNDLYRLNRWFSVNIWRFMVKKYTSKRFSAKCLHNEIRRYNWSNT